MLKKWFICLCALSLLLGGISPVGMAAGSEGEPITIRVFGRQNTFNMYDDWNQMLQWQEYEKRTNVHVEWTLVPSSALSERVNLALVSGDLPDAFMHSGLSTANVVRYAAEGVFIPLDEMLEEFAPNLHALMEDNPIYRAGITAPDKRIYTLPKLSANLNQRVWGKLWIRESWLSAVDKALPTTLDELYDVLVAFRDKDPNGNGLADEIPISAAGANLFMNMIAGAHGLYAHAYVNAYLDMDEGGALLFVPSADRYKETLQYIHKLYSEGLLDSEIFSSSTSTVAVMCANNQLGSFYFNHTAQTGQYESDYIGNPRVLEGPYGDAVMPALAAQVQGATSFLITSTNPYPERTLQWADYLYSDEGSLLYFMGIEGVSYTIDDKGEIHYAEVVTNNPDGLDLDEAISLYSVWPGMDHPGLRQLKYVLDHGDGLPKAVSITEAMMPWIPEEVWPPFWYALEDSERYALLRSDLATYVDQMRAAFVTGEASFDEWDAYLSTLKSIGMEEFMEISARGYELYKAGLSQ